MANSPSVGIEFVLGV